MSIRCRPIKTNSSRIGIMKQPCDQQTWKLVAYAIWPFFLFFFSRIGPEKRTERKPGYYGSLSEQSLRQTSHCWELSKSIFVYIRSYRDGFLIIVGRVILDKKKKKKSLVQIRWFRFIKLGNRNHANVNHAQNCCKLKFLSSATFAVGRTESIDNAHRWLCRP